MLLAFKPQITPLVKEGMSAFHGWQSTGQHPGNPSPNAAKSYAKPGFPGKFPDSEKVLKPSNLVIGQA